MVDFDPHAACTYAPSWRRSHVEEDGAVLARFQCFEHEPALEWSVLVPVHDVDALVRRFVDDATGSAA